MELTTDFGTFEAAYRRLSGAFSAKKWKPGEQDERCRTYFRILEPFPLALVLAAGKSLLETSKRMPAASEWLVAVKHHKAPARAVTPDVRYMTTSEATERAQAAAMGYVGQPCLCPECVRASIDHEPLRFVPTLRDDGVEERAFNPTRQVIETCGHWAHGDELARWYAARATLIAQLPRDEPRSRRRLTRLLHLAEVASTTTDREPGEEG